MNFICNKNYLIVCFFVFCLGYIPFLQNEADNGGQNEYSVIPVLDQSNYVELIPSELPEPSSYETTTFTPKRGLESSPEHGWNSNWQGAEEDHDDYSQSAVSMADAQSMNSQSASSAADAQSIHSAQSIGSEPSPDQPDGAGEYPGGSRVSSIVGKFNQDEVLGSRPIPTSLPLGTMGTMGPYKGYAHNPGQTLIGSPSPAMDRAEKPVAVFMPRGREPLLGMSTGGHLQFEGHGTEYTEWTENEIYQGRYSECASMP